MLPSLGMLLVSALFPSIKHLSTLEKFPKLPGSKQKTQIVSYVLNDLDSLETQAINQTEALRSQPWDDSKFDSEWRKVDMLWKTAANEAASFLPTGADPRDLQVNEVGTLVSSKLQPLHYEYVNRQALTAAMHAYHKSIFLAEQPEEGSPAQCDAEATFADSPEQWAKIVELRQESVQHLAAVSQHVSFYPQQVQPLQTHYQEKLKVASHFYQHSPWYYAIQKAVCATAWGEKAKQTGEKESWENSATLWKKGIELLENAPEFIPHEVPSETRDNYIAAQNNLELWRKNLKDAEARAGARR